MYPLLSLTISTIFTSSLIILSPIIYLLLLANSTILSSIFNYINCLGPVNFFLQTILTISAFFPLLFAILRVYSI